ncbi:MAG: hypothetical protein N2C14_14870, partial [Planctomycetales bacterium]
MSRTSMMIPLLLAAAISRAEEPPRDVDYLARVKPILSTKCYACHGALKQESELRLETRALMLQGGDDGAAIVPGNAKDSPLVQRITAVHDERMPPESQGSPLTAAEVALIRKW